MKLKCTLVKLLVVTLLSSNLAIGQSAGDYRSVATGNWTNAATWETFDGSVWTAAVDAPDATDGVITIQGGHNVSLNAPVTANQIVVSAGGTLSVNVFVTATGGNDLTLTDDTGDELIVNGTIVLGGFNLILGSGTIVLNGVFTWSSGTIGVPTTIGGAGIMNLANNDVVKRVNANLTNNGTINWQTGGTSGGIFFNNSTITNNGLFVEQFSSNRGFFPESGTNAFINNGTFRKSTTFSFGNFNVPFTNTGIIEGVGTINLNGTVSNTGTIRPGVGLGSLTVNPATLVGSSATSYFNIAGGTAGTDYDVLNLNAATNIDGTGLLVEEINQAAPLQTYTLMNATAGTITGTFGFTFIPQGYTLNYTSGGTTVEVIKSASTLPVTWGAFTARSVGRNVNLSWITIQEINTSHFEVEYSIDGRNFQYLTTLNAQGNSLNPVTYNYTHQSPDFGKSNFYRIKQIDLDGKFEYSAVRVIKFNKGNVVPVVATPNPVQSKLTITVQTENVRVMLLDINGRMLMNRAVQPGVLDFDMQNMPAGMYFLSVFEGNNFLETQKIIKQ